VCIFKNLKLLLSLGGNKQPISFRRQRLEIDCMLPEPTSLNSLQHRQFTDNSADPYMIDMIKLADERIEQLQAEYDSCKQAKEILETKVFNYKNQVGAFILLC
jgi:hypothetical protein